MNPKQDINGPEWDGYPGGALRGLVNIAIMIAAVFALVVLVRAPRNRDSRMENTSPSRQVVKIMCQHDVEMRRALVPGQAGAMCCGNRRGTGTCAFMVMIEEFQVHTNLSPQGITH